MGLWLGVGKSAGRVEGVDDLLVMVWWVLKDLV